MPNPPGPIPIKLSSRHPTIRSPNTLASAVITQTPTFLLPTSHVPISQASSHPYTFKIQFCAPLSSQSKTVDGSNYRNRPENFLNSFEARSIYELGLEPTCSEQYRIMNSRKLASVAISPDGPASSPFISLSKNDAYNCSIFATKFPEQLDSASIKFKAQV